MKPIVGFASLLALGALAGCLSPSKVMESFIGQPSPELVARWGPPQQRMPDGQGGEMWIYSNQRQWTTPGRADTTVYGNANTQGNVYSNPYGATYSENTTLNARANTTWTPPQTHGYSTHRTFFIDANGIIYRYAWKGL